MSISIVGGGPAGSSAAIFLARNGFDDIKLYEKSPSKRKPCGGGLTWRLFERYDNLLKDLEFNSFKSVLLDIDGTAIKFNFKKTIIKVTDRFKLDKHLRTVAESSGVKLIKKSANPCKLNSKIIVDARGVEFKQNSGIARVALCKLKNFDLSFIYRSSFGKKSCFWVFPINDEVADVGYCGIHNDFKIPMNKAFDWFVKNIGAKPIINMGHAINLNGEIKNLIDKIDGRLVIKIGERAGLVNPLNGEGIYHAIRSSELLNDSIKEDDIFSYENKINKQFKNEFFFSKLVRNVQTLLPNSFKISLISYLTKKFFHDVRVEGLSSSLV